MRTPIPRILLALDGKIEFVQRTNPFGSDDVPASESEPDHEQVANDLRAAMAFFKKKR